MAKTPKTSQQDVIQEFEIDATDKQILKHILTYPGITDEKIAALVNLSRRQVNARRNATKFKKAHDEYLMEPLEVIRSQLKKAARVLAKGLDSTNEKLKMDVAFKLLLSEGVLKREADLSQSNQGSGVIVIKHIVGGATIIGQEEQVQAKIEGMKE